MKKHKRKIRRFREWLVKKIEPDSDARMMMILAKSGIEIPDTEVLETEVVLNQHSYEFLNSHDGKQKYDAIYGLARQLADQLKDYVSYTEYYDEAHEEWHCKIELEVVKK